MPYGSNDFCLSFLSLNMPFVTVYESLCGSSSCITSNRNRNLLSFFLPLRENLVNNSLFVAWKIGIMDFCMANNIVFYRMHFFGTTWPIIRNWKSNIWCICMWAIKGTFVLLFEPFMEWNEWDQIPRMFVFVEYHRNC